MDFEFEEITIFIGCLAIILSLFVLFRWIAMTKHIRELRNRVVKGMTCEEAIATGDRDLARKTFCNELSRRLNAVYFSNELKKADSMNENIKGIIYMADKGGIEIPAHLRDGGSFIDYMNNLKGLNIEK